MNQQCCATSMDTNVRCENQATHMMVGYDHNLEPMKDTKDGNIIVHRGYLVAGEYPICEKCIKPLSGWALFRHYKIEVYPIAEYKPQLEVVAGG